MPVAVGVFVAVFVDVKVGVAVGVLVEVGEGPVVGVAVGVMVGVAVGPPGVGVLPDAVTHEALPESVNVWPAMGMNSQS